MIDKNYLDVIKKISKQLNSQSIKWALTGSASFSIQGLPFTPNDIDIQTDEDGAYRIGNIFKEHSIRPVKFSSNGLIRSHFGAVNIEGIIVEIMGDIEKFVGGQWEKAPDLNAITKIISVEGVKIPVLKIEYEAEAYSKLGRNDKAKLLYKYIDNVQK